MGKGANRFIHTEIRCQKAFLIISISVPPYNGQLRIEGNRYESIKIGEQYCGIGLSNVSTVVHKYNGDMKITTITTYSRYPSCCLWFAGKRLPPPASGPHKRLLPFLPAASSTGSISRNSAP